MIETRLVHTTPEGFTIVLNITGVYHTQTQIARIMDHALEVLDENAPESAFPLAVPVMPYPHVTYAENQPMMDTDYPPDSVDLIAYPGVHVNHANGHIMTGTP